MMLRPISAHKAITFNWNVFHTGLRFQERLSAYIGRQFDLKPSFVSAPCSVHVGAHLSLKSACLATAPPILQWP